MKKPAIAGPSITRVILYVKDIPRVAAFYQRFFGLMALPGASEGWMELATAGGGCTIALHQASVGQGDVRKNAIFLG